jgi:hypothetical protein
LIEFDTNIFVLGFGPAGVRAAADVLLHSTSKSEGVLDWFRDVRHVHCSFAVQRIESVFRRLLVLLYFTRLILPYF